MKTREQLVRKSKKKKGPGKYKKKEPIMYYAGGGQIGKS